MAYSVKSAAKALDMGVRTVWELVRTGEIDSFKIGNSRRIAREALTSYIKRAQAADGHGPTGPSTPPPPPGPKNARQTGFAA